jgi:abortive infection bacteriophage resistance protein
VGSFFTTNEGGKTMAQDFLPYKQQIAKLRDDKGLIVTDEDEARKILEEIGYYYLIAGYKNLFINPAAKKYAFGVTFNEIVAFYHFDEQLRSLFLKYILQVERHLKSLISYYFCNKYGVSQTEYPNLNNFDYAKHQNQVARLVTSLNNAISLPSNYKILSVYFVGNSFLKLR